MSFFSLLFALLIEQVRPLVWGNLVHRIVRAWVDWISQTLDTGHSRFTWAIWSLAVGLPALFVTVVHWVLIAIFGWPVAMIWSVAVLYVTLGFRQFSHHFTDIRDALDTGDEQLARDLLAKWQHVNVDSLSHSELLRYVIEYSVLSAHHHVFGVFAWFSVLAGLGLGPAGAVIYRMSAMVSRVWQSSPKSFKESISDTLQDTARQAWYLVDWLPARLTAVAFAVVGNFEEAIDCWRSYAQRFPHNNDGVVLAATAGALNVCLEAEALHTQNEADVQNLDSENMLDRIPKIAHLSSVVGLVWRSVVLWMMLLALLTLARLLG